MKTPPQLILRKTSVYDGFHHRSLTEHIQYKGTEPVEFSLRIPHRNGEPYLVTRVGTGRVYFMLEGVKAVEFFSLITRTKGPDQFTDLHLRSMIAKYGKQYDGDYDKEIYGHA